MSATGRGSDRLESDNYPTPAWCVRRLLEEWEPPQDYGRWIEPCAGEGAIVRAVRAWMGVGSPVVIEAFDVRDCRDELIAAGANAAMCVDWRNIKGLAGYDVVISNPPYSIAEPIIRHALEIDDAAVAMLLRSNFLGSEGRADWLRACPPDVYQLPNRPSFAASIKCVATQGGIAQGRAVGCGWSVLLPIDAWRPTSCLECGGKVRVTTSDATEYAWFVWPPERQRDHGIVKVLATTSLEERRAA
jgi:hypothetical protein